MDYRTLYCIFVGKKLNIIQNGFTLWFQNDHVKLNLLQLYIYVEFVAGFMPDECISYYNIILHIIL